MSKANKHTNLRRNNFDQTLFYCLILSAVFFFGFGFFFCFLFFYILFIISLHFLIFSKEDHKIYFHNNINKKEKLQIVFVLKRCDLYKQQKKKKRQEK